MTSETQASLPRKSHRGFSLGPASSRIAVAYIVFSTLWIVFSDTILHLLVGAPTVVWKLETLKGLVFVLFTGLCLLLAFQSAEVKEYTARRRAESAVRRLIQANLIGTFFWAADGSLRYANDAFLDMLGFTREDLKSGLLRWDRISPPEDRERDQQAREMLESSGVVPNADKEFLRKDGTRVHAIVGGAMLEGDPHMGIVYALDISALKAAQHESQELEEQLRQMQKLQAIGQLAGGVAHDFNNLLNVMMGYTSLIEARLSSDDPLRLKTHQVMRAGEKATALVRKLLAFSRRQELNPVVLDLNTILAEMGTIFRQILGEKIRLQIQPAAGLWPIKADPTQMEQVFMNLVVNARDAMPDGGKLTIETANVDLDGNQARARQVAAGPHVVLAVTDTGIGMSAETQAHIFEPFFTTKAMGEGTGLGLSTTYGIVVQSGGCIAVESSLGHGSTFRVYLPRTAERLEPRTATLPALAAQAAEGAPAANETLLVAEDADDLRTLLDHILRAKGYHVLLAKDGEQAVAASAAHPGPIHLMITDVIMPGLAGPQAARLIRQNRPTMKVIYISGYGTEAMTREGTLPQGESVIEKPFRTEVLVRKVRELLDAG
ncbi:MAG TPA: ATP-binding protein [Terriglobales bacterium]|nr:ATP-binding protein [Terriglobales bacterium]